MNKKLKIFLLGIVGLLSGGAVYLITALLNAPDTLSVIFGIVIALIIVIFIVPFIFKQIKSLFK